MTKEINRMIEIIDNEYQDYFNAQQAPYSSLRPFLSGGTPDEGGNIYPFISVRLPKNIIERTTTVFHQLMAKELD